MKREFAFVVAVLLVGYSLYGVILVAGLAAGGDQVLKAETGGVPAQENVSNETRFEFRESSGLAGFNYTYQSDFHGNQQTISNAGVYAADFNEDGWTDILAIGGSSPILFENHAGEFHRSEALPEINGTIRAALFFDYDGNGDPELLLLANDRVPLLLDWTGEQYTAVEAGFMQPLDEPIGATSADFDGDGCLDLFVIQYGNWSNKYPGGIEDYSVPFNDDNGNPDQLYYGNCSTFNQATEAGVRGSRWSLATSAADFDNDGDIDIHVANDFNYDVVYTNRGNGTFEQMRLSERTNRNGMSSEVSDVNGDGRLDVFVTNIYYPEYVAEELNDVLKMKAKGNNLLINGDDGRFNEQAKQMGSYEGGWGWAAVMTDFDNDGDEDLFHTTRRINWDARSQELSKQTRSVAKTLPYYAWPAVWQYADGKFNSVPSSTVGFERTNGRGTARLDYDRDGSMDLVVATTSTYRLYENTGEVGSAVQLRIQDETGARAIGARAYLRTNGTTAQWRSVRAFTDFLSQDPGIIHFGTGDTETVTLRVIWPDGTERSIESVSTGYRITVRPSGVVKTVPLPPSNTTTGPHGWAVDEPS